MLRLQANGALSDAQSLVLLKTKPAEELYDLDSDPHEIVNLADQPRHSKVQQQLAKQLDEWILATADTGLAEITK